MIILSPGFHPPQLTENFLSQMGWRENSELDFLVIPNTIPPYQGSEIVQWLNQQLSPQTPLALISFSAGVVGAIGAAILWEQQGGTVENFIAVDGWGVPLFGSFPTYRLSHDYFTHVTSKVLGSGKENFYCCPPVSHLEFWEKPQQAWGWWEVKLGCRVRCCAAKMMNDILLDKRQKKINNRVIS